MKIKSLPQDFVVEEVSQLPLKGGNFAIYRLEKIRIGTLEALSQLAATWNIPRSQFGYCGLKDRHAKTTQLISINHGPEQSTAAEAWQLDFIGKAKSGLTSKHLSGNQFTVVIRDLSTTSSKQLHTITTTDQCIPNYFDKQRFGSVTHNGRFVAVPWCKGDYERAVFLALAERNSNDSKPEQEQREILRENWGNWTLCKDLLARSNRRSVVTYLVDHPEGFKKAAALIDRGMRSLYVSAFQSRLWNEVTSQLLLRQFPDSIELTDVTDSRGKLVFPIAGNCKEKLELTTIPLPSGRNTRWPPKVKQALVSVLAAYDLELPKLRVSHPRDVFFSRASRSVWLDYQHISSELSNDEVNQGKQKLTLKFRLKPGQYATLALRAWERQLATFNKD